MKKILISFYMFLLTSLTIAQTGMPSQEEMDKMMKQMQDVMKDMPPETKKMMDSMGMKMPDTKNIPTSKQLGDLQSQYKDLQAQTKKDIQKVVANLPKKVFTDVELVVFLKSSFAKIDKEITPKAKANAQKIIAESNAKNVSVENSAIAALMQRGSQEALWILAKLASENPKNANLLCNYSATVILCQGSHLAVPVLNYLDNKYPNNSNVLNNLGQAWYSLQKIDSAEKYLKLALKIYPHHSTANRTMAKVCSDKGLPKNVIIDYLKNALKDGGYNKKIESDLKKLGVKLTKKDISWPLQYPYNPDPIGLKNLAIPSYPNSTKVSEDMEAKWKAFRKTCKEQSATYEAQAQQLNDIIAQKIQDQTQNAIKMKSAAEMAPVFADQIGIYMEEEGQSIVQASNTWSEHYTEANAQIKMLEDQLSKKLDDIEKALEKKYNGKCPGEGCPPGFCEDEKTQIDAANDAFLSAANAIIESVNNEKLNNLVRAYGIAINTAQYTSTINEKVDFAVLSAKASYLKDLAGLNCEFKNPVYCIGKNEKNAPKVKLADFDEITCKSEDKLYLGFGVGKIAVTCTKFSIEGGELIQGSFEQDLKTNEFEIGIGLGVSQRFGAGPLSAEGSAKAMQIFHFNEEGKLTDAGVKVSVGVAVSAGALTVESEGSVTAMVSAGTSGSMENSAGIKFLQE